MIEYPDISVTKKTTQRWALVFLMLVVAVCLSAVPIRIGDFSSIRPPVLWIVVYYWAIYRPRLISPLLAFMLGLLVDLIAAWPLGMTALLLVCIHWSIRGQRRFLLGQSFMLVWFGYVLTALAAGFAQWALFTVFYFEEVAMLPVLVSTILSVLLFPVLVLPLALVNRLLASYSTKK